jgi:Kef-type K+ transport system membrane component KefB
MLVSTMLCLISLLIQEPGEPLSFFKKLSVLLLMGALGLELYLLRLALGPI